MLVVIVSITTSLNICIFSDLSKNHSKSILSDMFSIGLSLDGYRDVDLFNTISTHCRTLKAKPPKNVLLDYFFNKYIHNIYAHIINQIIQKT